MTATVIISLIVSIISGCVGLTTLFTFLTTRKQKQREEGAKNARTDATLEIIKEQNEKLSQSIDGIKDGINTQNIKIARIEQVIEDANIAELPKQIAAIKTSIKITAPQLNGDIKQRRKTKIIS